MSFAPTVDAPGRDRSAPARTTAVRTVLVASLVGTTIEWYDFFLYATAASIVFNHGFFPGQSSLVGTMLAFATFAVGFAVSPVGGIVFGHVGDRIGRKRTLALAMFLMGAGYQVSLREARRGVGQFVTAADTTIRSSPRGAAS